jgi:mannose-6-phosphate isomerase-like protein (cupin superfamily)
LLSTTLRTRGQLVDKESTMDELDTGLAISLTGPLAEAALERFHRQIEVWGVAMPPVTPLVLDFGLDVFERVGLIEYWIANEAEAGYCGKFLYVQDGQTCPAHSHKEKMETFYIVKGRVSMSLDGDVRVMEPGSVLPVPPGIVHSFTGLGAALLLEVSKPCRIEDNYFEDRRIPIGGNYDSNSGESHTR